LADLLTYREFLNSEKKSRKFLADLSQNPLIERPTYRVSYSLCSILDINMKNYGTAATALAKALESNSSLTFLNHQYNLIGDTGAIALAKALESDSSLTFWYLEY